MDNVTELRGVKAVPAERGKGVPLEELGLVGERFDGVSSERWEEPEDDLPVYLNPTIEGAESEWTELDAQEDDLTWRRGAIAHSVSLNKVYGEGDIGQFSGRVGASSSVVYDWMATYRRLLDLHPERRKRVLTMNLRYSHYRAVNAVKDDVVYEQFLKRAYDEGWLTGRLAEAVQVWRDTLDDGQDPLPEPPETEPAEDGTGPYDREREKLGPLIRARGLLEGFLSWARNVYGYELVTEVEENRGIPMRELIEEYLKDEG